MAGFYAIPFSGIARYKNYISRERVAVDVSMDTFSAKVIPYKHVRDFLESLARMLSSSDKLCLYTEPQYPDMTRRGYVHHAIEQAVMQALWDNCGVSCGPSLVLHFSGAPIEWLNYLSANPRS